MSEDEILEYFVTVLEKLKHNAIVNCRTELTTDDIDAVIADLNANGFHGR